MNTAVKIKSCNRASASGKNAYNLERTKNMERDILVLEKNGMPEEEKRLTKEQKKKIKSLQSKLSVYKKRLAKATADGKEKSTKTNKKNIAKIQQELAEIKRSDGHQKHYTEFTIILTNSQKGDYAEDWSQKALDFIKKEMPALQIISAAEHRDQASPHVHILTHSPDKPVTQVLAQYAGQQDTKRESMKEAYSFIAHKFHAFANENIAKKELNPLQKGRKYVSLGQLKQKGNFEAKRRLQKEKATLVKLKQQDKELGDRLAEADRHLKLQAISLKTHTSKGLFGDRHCITQSGMESQRDSLQEYANKKGSIFDTDANTVKQTIDDYFKVLQDHSKKTKERTQPHFPKETVLKIKPKIFEQWKIDFNNYLKEINTNIKKLIDEVRKNKKSIQDAILQHPETIKQKKAEEVKRKEFIKRIKEKRVKQREQNSKIDMGR